MKVGIIRLCKAGSPNVRGMGDNGCVNDGEPLQRSIEVLGLESGQKYQSYLHIIANGYKSQFITQAFKPSCPKFVKY